MTPALNLRFKPIKEKIEDAGRRASRHLARLGFSEEAVRVQLEILRELIANARALDAGRRSGRNLAVRMAVGESAVTTEVSLRVDASDRPMIDRLEKTILRLRGSQSPFEAYLAACRESDGGAGLARIALESRATVDFFVDEDQSLTLSAVGPCRRAEPPAGGGRRAVREPASGKAC
jgi:hypothetical protein